MRCSLAEESPSAEISERRAAAYGSCPASRAALCGAASEDAAPSEDVSHFLFSFVLGCLIGALLSCCSESDVVPVARPCPRRPAFLINSLKREGLYDPAKDGSSHPP